MDNSTEPRAHKRFALSAAYRWQKCPGSVRLCEKAPPSPPSKYADDGTKAHTLLECTLRAGLASAAEGWESTPYFFEDLDVDMIAAVQVAVDYVFDIVDAFPDAQVLVEQRFSIPCEAAPDELGGTADIVIYIPSLKLLVVIDYKHGAGVAVEVPDNPQLLGYATGAFFALTETVERVRVVVVQPRCFHTLGPVREHDVGPDAIFDFSLELNDSVALCLSAEAPFVPGDKQCRFCEAKVICPALESRALSLFSDASRQIARLQGVQQATLPEPAALPVDRLAYILGFSSVLKDWLQACNDVALEYAKQGYEIPGRKLVESSVSRQWYYPEEHIATELMSLAGCTRDEVMPRKLISITAADKLVADAFKAKAKRGTKMAAAEEAKNAVAYLTIKEGSGSYTLAPLTDKRPAVSVARVTFAGVDTNMLKQLDR